MTTECQKAEAKPCKVIAISSIGEYPIRIPQDTQARTRTTLNRNRDTLKKTKVRRAAMAKYNPEFFPTKAAKPVAIPHRNKRFNFSGLARTNAMPAVATNDNVGS